MEGLVLVQRELLLFAAFFFALGALDEIVVDLFYLRYRLFPGARPTTGRLDLRDTRVDSRIAVFIPAWREDAVIAATIAHALAAWRHRDLTIYVGCYRNDPETVASAMAGSAGDPRLRIVIHDADGPTTKPDCLNRLWRALLHDEERRGTEADFIVLQDAEDMVDPHALVLMSRELAVADMVQIPVLALPLRQSRWVASHYSDEFAEAHGKTLVVRDALGAAIPGAGVGCAIARGMMGRLARQGEADGPFSPQALTEDYELGLRIAGMGGITRFVRARALDGRLVATRAYFPARLDLAVRQKTRWVHGIALQGWDRLGWSGRIASLWMQLRDRRGPLAALLLAIAYALVGLTLAVWMARTAGFVPPAPRDRLLDVLLLFNLAALAWRAVWRGAFTAREYGWREGVRAVPRLLVSNVVAIMAGRRALAAYVGTLRGAPPVWNKTEHHDHPALAQTQGLPA